MRPGFLIIGAQKAGTTSLYDYLVLHPEVGPAQTKEVHYFDINGHRRESWYRGHFPPSSAGYKITGEATPYYLFHPFVPARVGARLPEVKLIVLLRDPVTRALSHHNYLCRLGLETLELEAALDHEELRLAGQEFRLANPRYRSHEHQHHSYLARGRYAEQLERWFRVFSREQVLILSAEEFFARPHDVYRETLTFLDLSDYDPGPMPARNASGYPEIGPQSRDRLRAYYAPHNERLFELLGRDFGWNGR